MPGHHHQPHSRQNLQRVRSWRRLQHRSYVRQRDQSARDQRNARDAPYHVPEYRDPKHVCNGRVPGLPHGALRCGRTAGGDSAGNGHQRTRVPNVFNENWESKCEFILEFRNYPKCSQSK